MNAIETNSNVGSQQLRIEPTVASVPAAETKKVPGKKIWGMALIIGVLALGGFLAGMAPRWHQHKIAVADMQELAMPTVSLTAASANRVNDALVLPAEVKPWLEASIYARSSGYVKRWLVDIGAHVEAGQLLAEIDSPEINQQLEQAQAQLTLAQANLELANTTDTRWKELLKTASVSEQEAAEKAATKATAAANVEAVRAEVRRLQELQGFERVVAPFAGTITLRNTDIGDLIAAGSGKELFHLAQTKTLRVYVRVPQAAAAGIHIGQTAELAIPEKPGVGFAAKVITTSEAMTASSRTLLTELEVDNAQGQIFADTYAEVKFRDSDADSPLTIPSNALLFRAEGLRVGLVRPDDTVELRKVEVGRDFGQSVEVLSGLTPADRIIMNPADSLTDGAKVRVVQGDEKLALNEPSARRAIPAEKN